MRIAFWTMVAPSRREVLDLADKHHDPTAFERAVTLAWTQAQVQLYHLGVGAEEARLFQNLASYVLYSSSGLRPRSEVLMRNLSGQSALWAHRISGDLPIVLVQIDNEGAIAQPGSPDDYARDIDREEAKWSRVIHDTGALPK